jgi:type IV pilus assembly protein PilC
MLNKSADYMDNDVDNAIEALTTIIEPLMIVVMGCILMFVALALYLPMFELPNLMAGGG